MNLKKKEKMTGNWYMKSYGLLAVVIGGLYLLISGMNWEKHTICIEIAMLVGIVLATFIFENWTGKMDSDQDKEQILIVYIMVLGCIMRIGYMLYTPCNIRSHDLGELSQEASGHAGYILTLIETGHLPTKNSNQLYQQPFYYIVSALVSIGLNKIIGKTEPYDLVNAAKTVSCFASCISLIGVYKLCQFVKLKKSTIKWVIALIAFLPNFYLMGGRVNADALTTYFMIMLLLYTFYWQQEPSWKNTFLLAFLYGFAVMTKISCGLMALFTAFVMFLAMLKTVKMRKGWLKLTAKLAVFGTVSLPLGLWFSVRNYLLFKQKFTYVPKIGAASKMYCGDVPFVQRFIAIGIKEIFSTPYADPWTNDNYPAYLIKTAVFGEFTFNEKGFIPIILLFTNVLLVLIAVLSAIYLVGWVKEQKRLILSLTGTWLLIYAFSIRFNTIYPYGCSMDFRYIAVSAVIGALLIGMTYEAVQKETPQKPLFCQIRWMYLKSVPIAIFIFCLFSTGMYVTVKNL